MIINLYLELVILSALRTKEKCLPWMSTHNQEFQPHDEPGHGKETPKDNYF